MTDPGLGRIRTLKLRDKLFLSYALLSVVILLAAAWVIDSQVVAQARQQVQEEMKSSLPLYEAVWQEQAGRLSALGMAMAGSPIVKTIFGDSRASRDAETVRQMLAEFGLPLAKNVDLVVITDGGGNVVYSEGRGSAAARWSELPSARIVSKTQQPAESFELLDGRLYHLALAPVLSHSSSADFNNTLVVLVAGFELDRRMAEELKRRAHSDVLFFAGRSLYSSSLDAASQTDTAAVVARRVAGRDVGSQPVDVVVGGEDHIAFSRALVALDGGAVGHVVVLHSLASASRLFRAISSRLVLIGTAAVISALLVSYAIALRITRPIEALVVGAREFGKGNLEYSIDRSAADEIGQLASAFDQMRLSIRRSQVVLLRSERLATIGQTASGIIHDLRSPLAVISTAAEVFARTDLPPDKRQLLAGSQLRASKRMEAMLRELLEYSQGKYSLKLERHALAPLIADVTAGLLASSDPGITVEASVPPEIVVRADLGRIRRLFDNLLANSVQAMPEGGAITIRALAAGKEVRVTVADTGSGIPAQLRDRLFEPFVSRGKPGGTGLGLAIARSIAEAHGGSLTLVSGAGQPTEFCVELPLASEEQNGE